MKIPTTDLNTEEGAMDLAELTKLYDFEGRTAVVTGGTGVLCRAVVEALAGCGASVAVLARDRERAVSLFASVRGPGRIFPIACDVTKRDDLERASESVVAEFGRVAALVNGAGGNDPRATTREDLAFFDLPEDALRSVFDLNLLGTVYASQIFGRLMAARGEGVILNVSSMSATRPLTRVAAYSAAKAGVNSFTQWLAVHLATEYSPRIRVNAIAPGFFLTEQNRFLLTDEETGELTARGRSIIGHTPMGRFGEPSDLLGAALWLLSPASAFVTGVVVPVDGGFSAFGGV